MKELLIVNNNMKVGGVQKSLYNLLWSLDPQEYRVTLLLFSKVGAYLDALPETVRVAEVPGPFQLLSKSQGECTGWEAIRRAGLTVISRFFGRDAAIRLLLKRQPMAEGKYDAAIAFLNNGSKEAFYGGVQDYVLHRTTASRKVVFLHSDYQLSGAHHPENDGMMERFDLIAACSEGCRRRFLEAMPHMADRCVAVPNCHRMDEILALAEQGEVTYSPDAFHVVTVARMTPRKGLDRAIRAVAAARDAGSPVVLHIVGAGPMWDSLHTLAQELGLSEAVCFHGEVSNPYPHIKQADLMLLSSYHEAAPMVIDEARCLGVPILSTEIISTKEMVEEAGAGWVCANDQEALNKALCRVVQDPQALAAVRAHLLQNRANNRLALERFAQLFV